jgi:tRNA-dihydrouridine synthase C
MEWPSAIRRGCEGTGCVPTLKLRSGYDDDSLLRENLLAAQEGGAAFVTLHPRTRRQGYSGRANWKDIAIAVETLDVPVIGNGDVTSPERARALLFETGCAGIMVGRGAVQDPLVFRRIKAELRAGDWSEGGGGAASSSSSFGLTPTEEASEVVRFLRAFAAEVFADDLLISPRKRRRKLKGGVAAEEQFKLGKLKQIVKYLFAGNASLSPHLSRVLSCDSIDNGITAREMLDVVCDLVATSWDTPTDVLVDAFSMRTSYEGGRLLV